MVIGGWLLCSEKEGPCRCASLRPKKPAKPEEGVRYLALGLHPLGLNTGRKRPASYVVVEAGVGAGAGVGAVAGVVGGGGGVGSTGAGNRAGTGNVLGP